MTNNNALENYTPLKFEYNNNVYQFECFEIDSKLPSKKGIFVFTQRIKKKDIGFLYKFIYAEIIDDFSKISLPRYEKARALGANSIWVNSYSLNDYELQIGVREIKEYMESKEQAFYNS